MVSIIGWLHANESHYRHKNPDPWKIASETHILEVEACLKNEGIRYLEELLNTLPNNRTLVTKVINRIIKIINALAASQSHRVENLIYYICDKYIDTLRMRELLEPHSDPLWTQLFSICVQSNLTSCAEIIFSTKKCIKTEESFLFFLTIYQPIFVEDAIKDYPDPEHVFGNGDTPLLVAVKNRHPALVTALMRAGYNARKPNIKQETPLKYIVANDKFEDPLKIQMLESLYQGGYDFRIPEANGCTLYHYAAETGSAFLLKWARGKRIPVNYCNHNNETALYVALMMYTYRLTLSLECIEELIKQNANPNVGKKDKDCFDLFFELDIGKWKVKEKILHRLIQSGCVPTKLPKAKNPLPPWPECPEVRHFEWHTKILLFSKGFIRDRNDSLEKDLGYVGCVQGSKSMRRSVSQLSPLIFLPESFMRFKGVNPSLYMAFLIKRVGHAFSLASRYVSTHRSNILSAGFSEAFTVSMLASSVKVMSPQPNLSRQDFDWIFERLKRAKIADKLSKVDYVELSKQLQRPDYCDAVFLGCGHDWHFPGWIIFGDFLIFCNKGIDEVKNEAITIYSLDPKERVKLTADVLEKIIDRYSSFRDNYFTQSKMVNTFNLVKILAIKLKSQEAENCTYTTVKALILCLMMVRHLINQKVNLTKENAKSHWSDAHQNQYRNYKTFTEYDRTLVANHLMKHVDDFLKLPPKRQLPWEANLYYSLLLAIVSSFSIPGIFDEKRLIKRINYNCRMALFSRLIEMRPFIKDKLPLHF